MQAGFKAATVRFVTAQEPGDEYEIDIPGMKKVANPGSPVFFQTFSLNPLWGLVLWTIDGNVLTLTSVNGSINRQYRFPQDMGHGLASEAVSARDLAVWVLARDGTLLNVTADGERSLLKLGFGRTPVCYCADEGDLFVVDSRGSAYKFSPELVWTSGEQSVIQKLLPIAALTGGDAFVEVAAAGDRVFMVNRKADLVVLDRANGKVLGRWGLGGQTVESAAIKVSGGDVYVLMRGKRGCSLHRLEINDMDKPGYRIDREVIKDFVVVGGHVYVLTKSGVTLHDRVTLETVGAAVIDAGEFGILGVDGEKNVFLGGKKEVAVIRPLAEIELEKYRSLDEIGLSLLRCCKIVREFVKQGEMKEALTTTSDEVVERIAARIKAVNIVLDLGEGFRQELETIRQWYEPVELETANRGKRPHLFWQSTMHDILEAMYDVALEVLVLLTVKGETGRFNEFKKSLEWMLPLQMLFNGHIVFGSDFFFDFDIGTAFHSNVRRQLALLHDYNKVSDYLIVIEKYEMLEKFALHVNLPYYIAMTLFKLDKLDEWIDNLEKGKIEMTRESDIKEVMKKLCEKKRVDLMLRLKARIPSIAEDQLSIIFLTMIGAGDMDEAFNCLWMARNDRQLADFMRLLIMYAIEHGQVKKLLAYDFNKKTSMFTNELLCYSVRTLAVGATYYNMIKDRSEAASALYLYARSVLRSCTKDGLRKAEAALALCCSILEDDDCCIRSVSDNSLVEKKTILRLSRRVACLQAFEKPQDFAAQSNKEILEALRNIHSDKLITFCKLCSMEELSAFCQTLVRVRDFASLEQVLQLDKRTWNYNLHKTTLRAFLDERTGSYDPPVWIIDKLRECSVYDLLCLCKEYRRYDILEDIFTQLDLRREKLSRYVIPLLKSLDVPEERIASIT